MIFRAWEYADLLSVAALEKECFGPESWTFEMFASSFLQEGFFGELCEESTAMGSLEKKLVGYGCVQSVLDSADLMNIAVAPEYRGCGLGRALLKRLLDGARQRGVEKVFLEVRVSNVAAKNLYQSEGFVPLSVRKKYYPDGEDALVMVKELLL